MGSYLCDSQNACCLDVLWAAEKPCHDRDRMMFWLIVFWGFLASLSLTTLIVCSESLGINNNFSFKFSTLDVKSSMDCCLLGDGVVLFDSLFMELMELELKCRTEVDFNSFNSGTA